MEDNKAPIKYGKVTTVESYVGGNLHGFERSITESQDTVDLIDAQTKFFDITQNIIKSGKAKRNLTVTLDLDNTQCDVKRIHVTYIIDKEVNIPVKHS